MALVSRLAGLVGASEPLLERYQRIRRTTNGICEPLSPEDMVVQALEETSPTKWHLAHTTWFFETFILEAYEPGFRPYNADFRVLFNSYYQTIGDRHPRPQRGMLTRPGLGEVMAYRDTVDERVMALIRRAPERAARTFAPLLELGLQHEQQHQELLLMDVKRLLHMNPTRPAYADGAEWGSARIIGVPEGEWLDIEGGVVEMGHADPEVFAFDNEQSRHRRFLEPFQIRSRPVTNAEYAQFINDGGYTKPELWLDEGWSAVCAEGWQKPLYWERAVDGSWKEYTLAGLRPLDPDAPVVHISFFEADAFARWSGARLPTEAEWECAAAPRWEGAVAHGQFLDDGVFHPRVVIGSGFAGGVWEWTRSAHEPYPGYARPEGPVGEYNGKFMCGSFVLRGGACITPQDHIRVSYRNFFRPGARWAFAGLRLARGGEPVAPSIHTRSVKMTHQSEQSRSNLRPTIRLEGATSAFERDVVEALSRPRGEKSVSPRHLYDAAGSALFEEICELDEYYPTRTESRILVDAGSEIAEAVGPEAVLIEPGSGAAVKASALLRAMERPRAFVPIEISCSALDESSTRLAGEFPAVTVQPICGGFFEGLKALDGVPTENRLVFFPGSTLGNMNYAERIRLLKAFEKGAGEGGRVLLGCDLVKDVDVMLAAYDDARGISAAFARNLITRMNNELGAGLDPQAFRYEALWSFQHSRIEMGLVSERPQTARIGGKTFEIGAYERITTEYSYKFTREQIEEEAGEAGLKPVRWWTDADDWFALVLLERTDGAGPGGG